MLLDRSSDAETLRILALVLKAVHLEWNSTPGIFFRRLAQGLIRRHTREKA